MKKIVVILCLIAIVFTALFAFSGCKDKDIITIASKDFTEQDILGNMLLVYLSSNTDFKYEYVNEMGSNIVFEAIKSGDADIYVDYTGTVYGNYLLMDEVKSASEVYDITKAAIKEQFDLVMFESMGHNNTYTLSLKAETVEKYNLKNYTDLAKVANELVFGGTFEILNRKDGIPGLTERYGMEFKDLKSLDGTLRYMALEKNEVDVIDAFATDGLLEKFDLVTLEDDLSFFPPYYAVPIARADILSKYPELTPLLEKLKDILTDESMRELNYRVDVLAEDAREVATDFLSSKNLI